MKSRFYLTLLLLPLLVLISCQESENPVDAVSSQSSSLDKGNAIPGQYIVVFNDNVTSIPEVANAKAQLHGGTVGHIYSKSIKGFSVKMSAEAAAKLAQDPSVKSVNPDQIVTLAPPVGIYKRPVPVDPIDEVIPWGIARVGGAQDGTGKTVWVIDTGVDYDHPDLNVEIAKSVTFVLRTTTADDDHGHGTHVAGTMAALDNDIDVIGVAAGASVVGVKVLDKRGSGATSVIIAGIEYVAANAASGEVANMSLGGGVNPDLDAAVLAASETGVIFVLAAGNESDDANYHSPARVNGANIYTVSATDINDVFAYFSNYGNPPIEYAAPGYNILSLNRGGGTVAMSGTSMAAPHVAGLLAMGTITTDGYAINDPDGDADPIAHK